MERFEGRCKLCDIKISFHASKVQFAFSKVHKSREKSFTTDNFHVHTANNMIDPEQVYNYDLFE